MKKALAVLLSVLAIFSMFGVVACAEDAATDLVKVEYYLSKEDYEAGKDPLKAFEVAPGMIIDKYVPANPTKEDTETTRYIFKGWRCELDGEIYYEGTIQQVFPSCEPGSTVVFWAEFSEEDIEVRQTFWNLVESIFARFNLIFQYFAKIFEW